MSDFGFTFGAGTETVEKIEGLSVSPDWAWCYGLPHFDRGEPTSEIQFSCNTGVNSKLYVFEGEIWKLKLDAIIVGTNERMSERLGLNEVIFKHGGQSMLTECEKIKRIRTGTAAMTPGGNLPTKHVIHAVGPKYSDKYMTAAESTLHTAYRDALSIAYDHQFRFVGISCIYLPHKGYPREAAAHVAIRTVRKFIENRGNRLHGVVICLENEADSSIYSRLLPCYFPRSASEESLQLSLIDARLHFDNDTGACLIEDRGIRVGSRFGVMDGEHMVEASVEVEVEQDEQPLTGGDPMMIVSNRQLQHSKDEEEEELINEFTGNVISKPTSSSSSSSSSKQVIKTRQWVKDDNHHHQSSSSRQEGFTVSNNFTNLAPSPDEVRLRAAKVEYSSLSEDAKIRRMHAQWMSTAMNDDDTDFSEFEANHVIYQGGVDVQGRPIICLVGFHIPGVLEGPIKSGMLVHFIMKVMEKAIRRPLERLTTGQGLRSVDLINVCYFHGSTSDRNEPEDDWLNKVMVLFNYRYKLFIHAFYLVHWTVGLRFHLWAVLPSIVDPFWENNKNYGPIESFESYFSRDDNNDDDDKAQHSADNKSIPVNADGDNNIIIHDFDAVRQVELSYIDNLAELVSVMHLPSEDYIWLPAIVKAYDVDLQIL